jgi:hypothetical protein
MRTLDQLAGNYREEAAELVGELEGTLLELETHPLDADLVDRAFRQRRLHEAVNAPHGMGHGFGVGLVVVDAGGAWGGVHVRPPNVNVPSGFCWQVHVSSPVGCILPIAAPICSYRTY